MPKVVVEFNKLGKSYIIGHQNRDQRYVALRDVISDKIKGLWSRITHPEYYVHHNLEEFWALKDIDLEIKEGDRLGIIGRNGAGKTTLLKLLSRITEPTKGEINLRGRVASLLEVGTGFHPELTGRENIYLNGSILGMSRLEIKRKFDEIVDFAGVEQFLDTPVKRFSSGMYVRLGFSVAAHLEPEILVIDEVLAVGDLDFQKKCIGKMNSVAKEGRTILFVSHQMQAITNLCNRGILLEGGKLISEGSAKSIVDKYIDRKSSDDIIPISKRIDRQGNGNIKIIDTWLENSSYKKSMQVQVGSEFSICAKFKNNGNNNVNKLIVAFAINTLQNTQISDLGNISTGEDLGLIKSKDGILKCTIKKLPLNVGIYTYNIMIRDQYMDILDYVAEAGSIEVVEGDFFGTGKLIANDRLMVIDHKWTIDIFDK